MGTLLRMALAAFVMVIFGVAGFVAKSEAAITTVAGNSWSQIFTNTNAFPGTISYPVGTGSNATRMLVVALASTIDTAGSQTCSVTYGNQNMTPAVSDGGATQAHAYLFYLQEAGLDAASNANLVFTCNGSPSVNTVYATVLDGVDQSATPLTSSQGNTGTTSVALTTALTISADDMAVEVVNLNRTGTATYRTITAPAANWTIDVSSANTTDNTIYNSSDVLTDVTAGSTTAAHTLSSTTASIHAMAAMSIKQYTCSDPDPSTITIPAGQTATSDPYTVSGLKTTTGDVGTFEYKVTGPSATLTSDTYVGSTTWTAPAGVTSVDVEVWGGGGGGGGQGTATSDGGGGGGGSAYSKKLNIPVVPGNTYTVTVGTGGGGGNNGCGGTGGDSWFSTAGTVLAKGGIGGCNSTGTPPAGGIGGDATAGVGDTKFSGGQGEVGANSTTGQGGYGGSSAGTGADGWSGPQTFSTVTYPTANTPAGGGNGGNGGGAGANGSAPASGAGGGGGGSGDSTGTSRSGGAGAAGKVIITYHPQVTCTDWTTSSSIAASGAGAGACAPYTDGGTYSLEVRGTDPDCGTLVSAGPVDFTWSACSATAPADLAAPTVAYNFVELTWTYDGTNNTSYRVYRNGLQIASGITAGAYTDATVASGTAYTYTVRGFNGSCESGDSNAVPVTTPTYTTSTTTGAMSFGNVGLTGMTVTVSYSGDDDNNNSLSNFQYATDAAFTAPVDIPGAARSGKSWVASLTGLGDSTLYYFRATFADGGGVSGTNPVLGSQATTQNLLMHKGGTLGAKYNSGNWGGAYTCDTCHGKNTTPNIKRIRGTVGGSGLTNAAGQVISGRALSATDARGSETAGYASVGATNKVCDTCHSSTSIYKSSVAMTTSGTPAMLVGASPPHPADLDCEKCHEHKKGFKTSAGCVDCHAVGGIYQAATAAATIVDKSGAALRGEAFGGHLKALKTESLAGLTDTQWNEQCLKCHDGHVNTNGVHIPNNAGVGINYLRGYIALGGTATSGSTEAEICWNCHDLAANGISEWGTNTWANTGNSPYNYGVLTTSNWTAATWSSSRSEFAFKTGAIQSTHTANPNVTDAALSGSAYGYTGSPNAVGDIRCSYCHDVHNTAALTAGYVGDVNGKPYLRGSYRGNPYEEDGPPRAVYAGTTYFPNVGTVAGGSGWGAVPRGSTTQRRLGGYWIDQNNVVPMSATTTTNGTAALNPTSAWTAVQFGGLCEKCHGGGGTGNTKGDNVWGATEIDNLDQKSGESLWIGTNGHANSVKGGTGAASANSSNVFDARGGTTTASQNNPRQHYAGQSEPANSGSQDYGFRAVNTNALRYLPALAPGNTRPYGYNTDEWVIDESGATKENQYHKFSCSKCHNPHASRLPKLMITNCLDVVHNTWDNQFQLNTSLISGTAGNYSVNYNLEIAQWTSAQNCHRYSESNNTNTASPEYRASRVPGSAGQGAGWNKVTPWKQTDSTP